MSYRPELVLHLTSKRPFTYEGITYSYSMNAFQAQKVPDAEKHKYANMCPARCTLISGQCPIDVEAWDKGRPQLMKRILVEQARQNVDMATSLMQDRNNSVPPLYIPDRPDWIWASGHQETMCREVGRALFNEILFRPLCVTYATLLIGLPPSIKLPYSIVSRIAETAATMDCDEMLKFQHGIISPIVELAATMDCDKMLDAEARGFYNGLFR